MPAWPSPALRASLGPSWAGCADKPFYHPSPPSGWVNDPNGVCWAPDGALHTFFQHVEGSADWGWACAWGHAVSEDCGAWAPRPVALRPTPRGPDAAGAWSGCLVLPEPGANHPPTILYTGVGLRGGEVDERSPPVPPHADLGLPAVEVQCAAVATEDGGLDAWTKLGELVIEHAPELEGAALRPAAPATALAPHTWAGFRDPFVTHARTPTEPWRLLLGSGTGGNGAVLVYESTADAPATPAWRFAGFATTGAPRPTIDLGCMWECPFMVPVPEWDDGGDARGGGRGRASPTSRCRARRPPATPTPTCARAACCWASAHSCARACARRRRRACLSARSTRAAACRSTRPTRSGRCCWIWATSCTPPPRRARWRCRRRPRRLPRSAARSTTGAL